MKQTLESLGGLRLQALLLLLVVFLIGGLTGTAIERARHPRPPAPPRHGLPPHLRDALELSVEQDQRIDAILADYRPRTDALFDRIMPEVQALTDSMRAEIRAVLTPEQQAVFDRLEASKDGLPRRPGPPPDRSGPPPDRGRY